MGGGEILRFQWAERAIAPSLIPALRFFPNKNSFRKGVSYPTGIKKYGWDDYCYVG